MQPSSVSAAIPWSVTALAGTVYQDLRQLIPALAQADWPSLTDLSRWYREANPHSNLAFVGDDALAQRGFEGLYYEQVIARHKLVPTRERNWHDLFNALIWRLFPSSKATLSALHQQDIDAVGLNPRTPRRNRLTHFDECGVVLAYSRDTIPKALSEHRWEWAMYDQAARWGSEVRAFMFGHANYEMMLSPFRGLTGKWLGIEVGADFFAKPLAWQYQQLDQLLNARLKEEDCMQQKGAMLPLPLLGVPGWYAPQNQALYRDTGYFRLKHTKA